MSVAQGTVFTKWHIMQLPEPAGCSENSKPHLTKQYGIEYLPGSKNGWGAPRDQKVVGTMVPIAGSHLLKTSTINPK